jgi:hypothetical protein
MVFISKLIINRKSAIPNTKHIEMTTTNRQLERVSNSITPIAALDPENDTGTACITFT